MDVPSFLTNKKKRKGETIFKCVMTDDNRLFVTCPDDVEEELKKAKEMGIKIDYIDDTPQNVEEYNEGFLLISDQAFSVE